MHFRELADRYSLEKILRSARSGTVLRAVDSRSGQSVAIKLIPAGSPAALAQLAPELDKLAAVLAEIRHPNLPAVIDSGLTTDGSAFLVMELLEGKTLDLVPGPPLRVLGLLFQGLNGLEALACRGLAHLNVSPDNLLVTGPPETEQVKVLGLGSALFRAAGPASAEAARFQAPEVSAPGAGKPDWHADLYSFALTCCHALGATVRLGDAPEVQLPFALTLELDSCEGFLAILERCLRKNPDERPSHQEIRDAFRMTLGAAAPAPSGERPIIPKLVLPAQPQPPAAVPAPEAADGELLSSITDEVLDALAAEPPSRPAADAAAAQAATAPQGRAAMAAALREEPTMVRTARSRRLAGVLAAAAGVLALGAGAAFWWLYWAPAEVPLSPARAAASLADPDSFAVLAAQAPGAADPAGARDRAAAAVESEAEALAGRGMYGQAVARLEPMVFIRPDRPGLNERIAAYERYRASSAEQQALLDGLSAYERRKRPHEGLEKLRGVEPVPHLAPLFAEVRRKLEAQLQALDGGPPQIELRDGYALYYDRGQAVELSFRITDDYELTGVKMMARPEGGKMREMELARSSFGYTVELPPAFHRNSAIDFYVVATDPSGHEGWFGTPDKPQKVERRQGFDQLVR
ncbi:MAG TPA: hypothetical protein VF756_09775 [Thermoanaerobaculia bacterium]